MKRVLVIERLEVETEIESRSPEVLMTTDDSESGHPAKRKKLSKETAIKNEVKDSKVK